MDIYRRGQRRDCGLQSVVKNQILKCEPADPSNNVRWDGNTKKLAISLSWNTARDGVTEHCYFVELSLADMVAILRCLARDAQVDPAEFTAHLAEHRELLVRLLAGSYGYALEKTPPEVAGSSRSEAKNGARGRLIRGKSRPVPSR